MQPSCRKGTFSWLADSNSGIREWSNHVIGLSWVDAPMATDLICTRWLTLPFVRKFFLLQILSTHEVWYLFCHIETQKSYIQFGCSFFVLQFYMLSVRPFLWHNKATKGAELMPEIIPIRDLKNTNAISQRCHETQEPIFVTKSGYGNMVIMSIRAPRILSGEFLFISSRVFFLAHCWLYRLL